VTARPRDTHWADVAEVGSGLGVWFLYTTERLLGRRFFRVALAPVALFYVLTRRLTRESSREYLARVGVAPTWRNCWRHVSSFAESLLDKVLAVSGHYPFQALRFSGREVMLESLAAGRGGVLITAHLGCLEVCRLAAENRRQLRLNVLVHTRHAGRFNAVLKRLDPRTQVQLLQVDELGPGVAAMLARRVEAGEFIVITGDRVPRSGRTATAPFLGAPAHFPIGPWVLAAALGCQVILFSVIHEDRTYRALFEKLTDRVVLPRGDREAALAGYVARYAGWLETLCRRSPLDWYNFFHFWEKP
jgi:predicted LPLAT superfamily acyltransferase